MRDKLTNEQQQVVDELFGDIKCRMTNPSPKLFIIIGQVGAGKSTVSKYIADKTASNVVNANYIRLMLKEAQNSYAHDRLVAEIAIARFLDCCFSVVADSDHGDARKRKSLLARVKRIPDLRIYYVRVHSSFEVVAKRIIDRTAAEERTIYGGSALTRLREFWRRTPHHYYWEEANGGEWKLKEPPVPLLVDLDTGGDWQEKLDKALSSIA